MKGKEDNVGEDKRKEERNDGGKEWETAEVHAVLTGDYTSTYVRVLERISQYENESYRISPRKLPNFYAKVTDFHFQMHNVAKRNVYRNMNLLDRKSTNKTFEKR